MKLLLLQARKAEDPAANHECSAFARVLGVGSEQLTQWDLLAGAPNRDDLQMADCVLVGGAGDFGVGDAVEHAWLADFINTMGMLTDMDVPVFASCFGFQALVVACGGRVEMDKSRAEIGTFAVTVTDAGRDDPLFQEVAPRFFAQFGHKDHVTELPSSFVNLASTERSEFQAFRIPGKRFYATQFHPELSMEENRQRSVMYASSYTKAGLADTFEQIMASFRESERASALLRHYLRDHLGLYAK